MSQDNLVESGLKGNSPTIDVDKVKHTKLLILNVARKWRKGDQKNH